MEFRSAAAFFVALLLQARPLLAQSSCATPITPSGSIKPSVASGYAYGVVATGLHNPRSLEFDSDGNLFVLEQNKGLSKHVLQDGGGTCVSVKSSTDIINDVTLTHGLAMQGSTIYVSSANLVYKVTYSSAQSKVLANTNSTIVTGMAGTDHTTRTLLLPNGMNSIIVSRGSIANIDPAAGLASSGHSSVKMFSLQNIPGSGYVHNSSGTLLGWGLRNDVGVAVHPNTSGVWTVENSVDQLSRDSQDVHEDNPGEELNFLGYLNGTKSANQGSNFGYPYCFTAWKPSELPANGALQVGSPFSPQSSNDSACAKTTAPRLTFQAHMAPLDIKFNDSASEAWVTFHGSWDRDPPVGYGVALVSFGPDGMPTEPSTSSTAADFIFANMDISKCPNDCFRPAGMTFDSKGRLYVASDASGEVYVIDKVAGSNGTGNSSSTGSSSSGSGSGSGSDSGADGKRNIGGWAAAVVTAICLFAALI